MPESESDRAARLQGWVAESAKLVDQLNAMLADPATATRMDGPYKVLYAQAQDALKQLEAHLRMPPDASVADALAAFWTAPGPFMGADKARMRRALQAAFNAIVAGLRTVRLKRGLREFSSTEIDAGVKSLQAICKPGGKLHTNAEHVVRTILKAVSNAGRENI